MGLIIICLPISIRGQSHYVNIQKGTEVTWKIAYFEETYWDWITDYPNQGLDLNDWWYHSYNYVKYKINKISGEQYFERYSANGVEMNMSVYTTKGSISSNQWELINLGKMMKVLDGMI